MAKDPLAEVAGQSARLPIISTGTLTGDVALIREWLDGALADTTTGREWQVLDPDDPMGTIGQLAAYVGTLNLQLRAQGFRPPDVSYWDDPLGFMQQNVAFFSGIAGHVREPQVTVH